jgi:hypothetical protein
MTLEHEPRATVKQLGHEDRDAERGTERPVVPVD